MYDMIDILKKNPLDRAEVINYLQQMGKVRTVKSAIVFESQVPPKRVVTKEMIEYCRRGIEIEHRCRRA